MVVAFRRYTYLLLKTRVAGGLAPRSRASSNAKKRTLYKKDCWRAFRYKRLRLIVLQFIKLKASSRLLSSFLFNIRVQWERSITKKNWIVALASQVYYKKKPWTSAMVMNQRLLQASVTKWRLIPLWQVGKRWQRVEHLVCTTYSLKSFFNTLNLFLDRWRNTRNKLSKSY